MTFSSEKNMIYIPEVFSHGSFVLSDITEFIYKYTDVCATTSEGVIP